MMKFVVSYVVAGRDSSISEMVRPGKRIEVGFSGFHLEKGGAK